LRVVQNARQLQSEVGGDRLIIDLSALLHDVGDAKFHAGRERSGEFAREILGELQAPAELIHQVAEIVDNISFRKRVDANTLSLEGKIVQDADRLDALGAIGIVRTIEFGAEFGQPFWSADRGVTRTGVGHFYEKLFKLTGLMNTAPARRIAQQRETFMRHFLDQFFLECDHEGRRHEYREEL
jgi:uncharacterized protein